MVAEYGPGAVLGERPCWRGAAHLDAAGPDPCRVAAAAAGQLDHDHPCRSWSAATGAKTRARAEVRMDLLRRPRLDPGAGR